MEHSESDNEKTERIPYLELGEQTPVESVSEQQDEWADQVQRGEEAHVPRPSLLQHRFSPSWRSWLILSSSLLVIFLLLPRFLIVLSSIAAEILLAARVILPIVAAVWGAIYLLRLLYSRTPRP